MDGIIILKTVILGIVEGLTEFLPVSSTGHLILAQSLLGLSGEFWDNFEVAIQFGSILAVMWLFRERITNLLCGLWRRDGAAQAFALNIVIATVPILVVAALFGKTIKHYLFNPVAVAVALIVGGVLILWAERRHAAHEPTVQSLEQLKSADALKVGVLQILAVLFPGTSRSGATIIGGMWVGLSREVATQFSFFLAMPVLFLAFVKGLWDMRDAAPEYVHNGMAHALSTSSMAVLFVIGFVVAFISALVCVRWLLQFVSHHDFKGFAWYRIVFGIIILAAWQMGWMQA